MLPSVTKLAISGVSIAVIVVAGVLAFVASGDSSNDTSQIDHIAHALSPYVAPSTRVWQVTCSSGADRAGGAIGSRWDCVLDTWRPKHHREVVAGYLTHAGWTVTTPLARNPLPGPPLALLAPPARHVRSNR